jgi:hypothetical protein
MAHDDLKLSHLDDNEVTKTIKWLKSIYGEDMHVSRVNKHDNLGVDLDFSVTGEVKVSMVDYLKRVINEFPKIIVGIAVIPATDRLFTIRWDEELMLLLYTAARSRKDIQTAVDFLMIRV